MKRRMTYVLFGIVILLLAYVIFTHRHNEPTVAELQGWFSSRLAAISDGIEADIALDRQGRYPHRGRETFEPQGRIAYLLVDKSQQRFDISQFHSLRREDIEATPGYRQLAGRARELGLDLRLEEVRLEGDGVDTWFELDEYVHDIPRYFTVTVSGWK